MTISATIKSAYNKHDVTVSTDNNQKKINIPYKAGGYGSSANGGELLFLALATCFCNDIYREAIKRKITINSVEVFVTGEFGKEGEAASGISYTTNIDAPHCSKEEINELIVYVDKIAEVHNTLRKGISFSISM